MQYLLLMYQNEAVMRNQPQDRARQVHGAYMAYLDALKKAGVLVANAGLQPTSAAATVRAPAGKAMVLNGPFAETREQLAGYFLIDVPDLDTALFWAERNPSASHGAVEVRPVWA